jgi:hypothetical protein
MDHQKELVQQGILDGVIQRGKAGIIALILGLAACGTYFIFPVQVFGVVFVAGCFIAIEPHLYLFGKREYYRSLSSEERKHYISGFGYVITNSNLKYYLIIGLALLVYQIATFRV